MPLLINYLKLLKEINAETKKTVIVITHNQPIADIADKVIKLRSGEIVEMHENPAPMSPDEIEW